MIHSTPSWLQAARLRKNRRWRPLWWAGLLALTGTLAWQALFSGALKAADTLALSAPWRFVDESKPGSPLISGGLDAVTADAPAQVAARFNISSTMQALALQLNDPALRGLALAQVQELSYCTHLIDSPRPYAVTLQVNIDADVTDGDESWQGRLVYTPADNGAVIQGEWQCWNTLAGKWWATGGALAQYAPVDNPQALATLLARFPHLGVNAAYGVIALKAGAGWSYFQGEASPVVIGVEGDKIDIAFASAPHNDAQREEVLLPVLMNQAPTPEAPQNHGRSKKQDKDNKKSEKPTAVPPVEQEVKQEEKRFDWRATDWAAAHWGGFDWQNFDWDKVDWEHLDWGAYGWGGSEHAEAIRAFVADVQQCKENGWQALGFHGAGDCVAYYIKAHAPTDLDWSKFGWGRSWMNQDGHDDHDSRSGYGHHGDDN